MSYKTVLPILEEDFIIPFTALKALETPIRGS
jgi:hypothetical protein